METEVGRAEGRGGGIGRVLGWGIGKVDGEGRRGEEGQWGAIGKSEGWVIGRVGERRGKWKSPDDFLYVKVKSK